MSASRDNTGRERVEEERDRFFNISLDMLCIAKSDGYFKRLNPSFTETLGWSIEELMARPFIEFVHPEDRERTLREVDKQVKSGEPVLRFENRYQHKDGSWRWLSWRSVPQPDGLMYAVARDVTEFKQVEEALRESESKYRTLFESIDEGFCIIEMMFDAEEKPVDYRFLEINPSFERHTGLRDAVGKRMRELAPQHEAHWFEIYGRIALTGEPARFQNRAEQLRRTFDVYAFRFGEPKDRHVAILFSDITERKLREDEVGRLNTELSQRAAQLEAANKELEAFSYSVSHDLRAPLRAVDGFSQAVLEDFGPQLPEEGQRYLKRIRGGAQQMGQLIDDLLAFSRLSRQPLTRRPVETDKLVREVLEDLKTHQDGRHIDIRIGDLPVCQGDPALLKQVWMNLLSNALKYSRKREKAVIEIGVVAAGADRGGSSDKQTEPPSTRAATTYFVRDNGTGFDMQYVDKLFRVFQRLHRAVDYEGTGVGLAIVQRIINRHGGRVWAEAEVDRGATFYFTL